MCFLLHTHRTSRLTGFGLHRHKVNFLRASGSAQWRLGVFFLSSRHLPLRSLLVADNANGLAALLLS